jgi:hypothetical protein
MTAKEETALAFVADLANEVETMVKEERAETCRAITAMLDQLDRGNWVDELGHAARMNVAVIKLRELVAKAGKS